MAAYLRVYDSRHLQADCQEPGSAPEPYARLSSMGYLFYTDAAGAGPLDQLGKLSRTPLNIRYCVSRPKRRTVGVFLCQRDIL